VRLRDHGRDPRKNTDPHSQGEWIDLALYEGLYRLIEWQVIFYDPLGENPTRVGNQLSAPRSVQNVAELVGEPLEEYATPTMQVARREHLDQLVREWICKHTLAECMTEMGRLEVVASPIFTVEDILADQTFRENGNVTELDDPDLGRVRMQNVVPRFKNHTGKVWRTAPAPGEDNDAVYGGELGFSADEIAALHGAGTI
jgi:crotonobetainyl-CoA:carnitine CoA-transferase CaiB-like acyl-CoA transferase